MNRSATYDFLLTFHGHHVTISYHFPDKLKFRSKIAIFFHPVYFPPLLKGFLLEWVSALESQTRMMGPAG